MCGCTVLLVMFKGLGKCEISTLQYMGVDQKTRSSVGSTKRWRPVSLQTQSTRRLPELLIKQSNRKQHKNYEEQPKDPRRLIANKHVRVQVPKPTTPLIGHTVALVRSWYFSFTAPKLTTISTACLDMRGPGGRTKRGLCILMRK